MVRFLKSIAAGIFTLEDGEDGSGHDGSAAAALELGSTGEQQLWDRIVIVLHSTKGIALHPSPSQISKKYWLQVYSRGSKLHP